MNLFNTYTQKWLLCVPQSWSLDNMFSNRSDGLSQLSLVFLAPVTHSLPRRAPASGTLIFLRMSSALAGPEWSWKCNNEIIGSYIHSILANYLQIHIKYCKFFIISGTGWTWNIEIQSTRVCCCRKKCAAPENLQVLPSQMGRFSKTKKCKETWSLPRISNGLGFL